MSAVVVVSAARTPFGALGGMLRDVPAVRLGALAIREAMRRIGMEPGTVMEVVMGMVVAAGAGQNPARQSALSAGIPDWVPAMTVNKVCSSSLKAVTLSAKLIEAEPDSVFAAGGMESMSGAPYLCRQARWGNRLGNAAMEDSLLADGLTCPVNNEHMILLANRTAAEYGVGREQQDRLALRSQHRWQAAESGGLFDAERFAIEIQKNKETVSFMKDESPRPGVTLEALSRLKPVLDPGGTITAGNAPGVNDGATALILTSRGKAGRLGLEPLASVVSSAQVSADPKNIATVPGLAIRKLLDQTGMKLADIDLLEVNEAFAAVPLVSCLKILGMGESEMDDKVNVNGSSIAVGHPIGATGARILMTLIYELRRRKLKMGIAAICSGLAQGDAVLVRIGD